MMAEMALDGLRVIEYSDFIAGAYCTKLLADLGAEVIKVEPPGGCKLRRTGPFYGDLPDIERSGAFLYLNTNKLGITLAIQTADGSRIFRELAKEADIVVVETEARLIDELGLNYESLKMINPKLVVTAITPFGLTGPYKDYRAYPLNTFHAGGEGYLLPGGMEYLDRPPIVAGGHIGEHDAGINAAIATLAGLYHAWLTGDGQQVDVSKQESIMFLYLYDLPRYANLGQIVSRATQGYAIGGIQPCKDGNANFVVFTQADWENFLRFMGEPEWAKGDLRKLERAWEDRELVNAYILEWLAGWNKEDFYHEGQKYHAIVGKICSAEDLLNSEHLRTRGFFVEIEHPKTMKVQYPSACYKFSHTPWSVRGPAPLLGEHNQEIYCQRLGLSETKLSQLKEVGVI